MAHLMPRPMCIVLVCCLALPLAADAWWRLLMVDVGVGGRRKPWE